jgi:predicted nucleic acid-binding protein
VITALDTDVLLSVFTADPVLGPGARELLRTCIQEGGLVACDIVWAEIVGAFPFPSEAQAAMDKLGVGLSPLEQNAVLEAGKAWKLYRGSGESEGRMPPAFLVGAHALHQAQRLVTQNQDFYSTFFPGLSILVPQSSSPSPSIAAAAGKRLARAPRSR